MLSDIYGEDKREKFLIIKSLIRDRGCIGVVYGKKGIGKKYVVRKIIEELKKEEDIFIFIESPEKWQQTLLHRIGVHKNLSKEEFLIQFYEFLHSFKGRIYILFNNSHFFAEKQFLEIVRVLGLKEKITVIFVGEEEIKQLLTPVKMGKLFSLINFIFEISPPDFEEFHRFLKDRYGEKFPKWKAKRLFNISKGSLSKAVEIVESGKSFSRKGKLWYFIPVLLAAIVSFYLFYNPDREEKRYKVIKDMKLPVEGSVEDSLPVKVKKKKFHLILNGIEDRLSDIYRIDIPQLKFYQKKYEYIVQVATFKNEKYAEKLKNRLLQAGIHTQIENVKGFYRINVYTSDRNELEKVLKSLKEMGFKPISRKVK